MLISFQLQKALFSEKVKNLCSKLTNKIVKNVFCDSLFVDRYYYNDDKMNYLYRAMQSKKSLSIDELLCQCMQLEESFRENYLNLISRTAVTLLKKEVVPNHDKMTNRELNAHKTVLVAMDCIDLLLSTYEPDYDEACQKINSYLMNPNLQNTTNSSGSGRYLNNVLFFIYFFFVRVYEYTCYIYTMGSKNNQKRDLCYIYSNSIYLL